MKITIAIELDNDGMRTPGDVLAGIKRAFAYLTPGEVFDPQSGAARGGIRDINGNRVGAWEVTP